MTKKKIKEKFNVFVNEYESKSDEEAFKYIRDNFWKYRKSYDIPDILIQVYSELGLYNNKTNIYLNHLKKIKSLFPIDCNILEIGGGMIPVFANILAHEQLKLGKGTVTVYDPMMSLICSKYKNLKLIKEKFDHDMDISKYDLIIGILPCEASEEIIKSSCNNHKNFYLQMCGCTHFTQDQIMKYGLSDKAYHKYLIELASKLLNENIKVDKIENKFGFDYPIIYKKF